MTALSSVAPWGHWSVFRLRMTDIAIVDITAIMGMGTRATIITRATMDDTTVGIMITTGTAGIIGIMADTITGTAGITVTMVTTARITSATNTTVTGIK